ncbi:MAG: hypothetical protein KDD60_05045 [Bdellovibrionales bacterium]|nr:hypothetical protein [Bdellovibrionales bacterium]
MNEPVLPAHEDLSNLLLNPSREQILRARHLGEENERLLKDHCKTEIVWRGSPLWSAHHRAMLYHAGRSFFAEALTGTRLLDGGGGINPLMARFSEDIGIRTYMNIDRLLIPGKSQCMVTNLAPLLYELPPLECEVYAIQFDLLEFLIHLPDEFTNITLNSLGQGILYSTDYAKAVAEEITRVLPINGLVLNTNSLPVLFLNPDRFVPIPPESWGGDGDTETLEKMTILRRIA